MTAADYQQRAQQHRPADLQVIGAEVRRLRAQGLTERDIGQALRLDPSAVRAMINGAGIVGPG